METWDEFDELNRRLNRQGTRMDELIRKAEHQGAQVDSLEQRIAALEARLAANQTTKLTLVKNEDSEASRIA